MTDVVIRMNNVPRFCQECPIKEWGGACAIAKQFEYREDRPPWCPIISILPDRHGPLVDFDDVSKELRKYGYVVQNETTGMKYMEYPIVMELDPIRVPVIVPATKGGNK